MKNFISAVIIALLLLVSLLTFVGSLAYFCVYLLEEPTKPFNLISIPISFLSGILCVLTFKVGMFLDNKEKEKRRKKYYDEHINPDNAEIIEFSRKNEGAKICKFNKGISLAFIDERIWCAFKKQDGKILLFHPPGLEIYRVNAKFIEKVKVEDLPRIS